VGEAIKKINTAGILAVVTTNQPVLARGELKELELKVIHNKMDTLLGRQGAYIDRIYYCPHHPDKGFKGEVKSLKFDCDCRKPEAGLFIHAKNDLNINLEESWVVGDRTSDIMAAHNTGMRSVLVKTGYAGQDGKYDVKPDFIANDLKDAVEKILKVLKK
jgi:histidinol-phosphate phosphatase family protein